MATSSSSVIATSYYDVLVLGLLQQKISNYLKIGSADFFNFKFNTTRLRRGTLVLTYSFSSRDLIQDSCNISAINNLRSKLDGKTAREEFRQLLLPQFDLNSIAGESFESSCSGLSSRLPTIGVYIGNFEIVVGKFFSFNISTSAFASPTGHKMGLNLELRFENNSKIPSKFWIGLSSSDLDAKPALQGIVTPKLAQAYSSISIKVVAITPLLAEVSQMVNLTMQASVTKVSFSVVMIQSYSTLVPVTTFLNTFLNFMSSFLKMSQSSFSILDYFISSNVIVKWTILLPSPTGCEMSKIQEVTRKLLDDNGNISSQLKNGLVNNVNFNPSKVQIKLAGSCDVPTIVTKIPELMLPKYDFLSYEVPANAFRDQTDSKLNIKLLLDDGSTLPKTSWIWYNNITRRISGFPFVIANGTYKYILRATDLDGHYADQNISVLLDWTQPSYNFFYQLRFSFDPNLLPYSNVITTFIQSIKTYFKQFESKNIIIFRPLFLANNRMSLYFQNTSLSSYKCDVAGNNYILSKIQDSSDPTKPSQEFTKSMEPHFGIEQVVVGEIPSCSKANRKPPYFNSGNSSIAKYYSDTKVVKYCDVISLLIPANTFLDEEEGNTRDLRLTLKSASDKTLPVSNWIALNASSQIIFAAPSDSVFFLLGSSYDQYKLIATDSDSKSSNTLITFNISGPPPPGYYNVTMTFNISVMQNHPYVFQIDSLVTSLKQILMDGPSIHVRSYDLQRIGTGRYLATLVWSPCHMKEDICDTEAIEKVKSKLFSPGTSNINPILNSTFDTRFRITGVKESRTGPCSIDPPYIQSLIPRLHVTFREPFSYKIPDNVFRDKQDGNTRNLKLNLKKHDGTAIASSFWLQFDSKRQEITAVLTKEQNATGYPKEHLFMLTATDKSNLSTNTTVKITISGIISSYSHTFTIETIYSLPSNSHVLYHFAKKMTDYLGKNLEVISKIEASGKNLIVSWTNGSLRYEPCDVLGIKHMRDRMLARDGTISNHFKKAMEPEFTHIFLKEVKFGPCLKDLPPVLNVPFGPITVTTCGTYKAKVPEDTFNDREQGNTRNLDLKVKEHPYYWIRFDAKQQEISILLTTEVAKQVATGSVTITLTATDLFLHVAEQRITINIDRSRLSPNHKILMHFMITATGGYQDFVTIYDEMRKRLLRYFQGNAALASLEYDSLPSKVKLNTILRAEWSSCSLAQNKCEKSQIDYLGSLISSNNVTNTDFKQALLPIFEVASVNTTFQAQCNGEIPTPFVLNPLPIIDVKFCGYRIYRIPVNTFYDTIDGDTRNLELTILNGSDHIATEPWFDFDSAQQSLRILLADNFFTNVVIPSIFTYKLKATTKRGLSVYNKLQFKISSPHPNASFSLNINFVWQQVSPPSKLEILITFMNRIAAYLGKTSGDIRFVSITPSPISIGENFAITIANCSARYNPCDKGALEVYSQKFHDIHGVKEAFIQAMGTEIANIHIEIGTYGPCIMYNTPPRVMKPLAKVVVHLCSEFNYTIPASTFFDKEQSKLQLSITEINGKPLNASYQWISIDHTSNVLYGFISDSVLISRPANGYIITIRATDIGKLFTEGHLNLDISGSMPQKFYQFTMTLRPLASISSLFLNEISIIRLLNGYFKTQFAHLINTMRNSSMISVRSSICPLPKKCNESLALFYFNKITTSKNTVPTDMASYFAQKYIITATSVLRNPLCQAEINPPVPSRLNWEITASYCGGFRHLVPANMFTDKEDGNTRSLELTLHINSTNPVPHNYWVQLNKTSQEIYGFPTREISLSPPNNILLLAKDSTGYQATVTIKFTFTSHPEPKYIYKIVYKKTSVGNIIDDIEAFSFKLRGFLSDRQNTSFGLIKYSHSSDNNYYIDYANCSISYNPCNIYALNLVKDRLFTSDHLPTNAFKMAMEPIIISNGRTQALAPCLGNLKHPPTVRSQIIVLDIPVWSIFTYRIPADTFYDTEDGNTRNLALFLSDDKGNAINANSWLRLNSTTQTIRAFGFASMSLLQPPSGFSFILTATDSSKLSVADTFRAKIYGPIQFLRDCKIQMRFNVLTVGKTNHELITKILENLARFFSLKKENIGLIDFIHHTGSQYTISWSYISNVYHKIAPSSSFDLKQVDYTGLVRDILAKLFLDDRQTVQPTFYATFSDISIISVKTVFIGICNNIPPLTVASAGLGISVPFAGYKKEAIQPGWFYDYESGNAHSLRLQLLSEKNTTVPVESWVNIDIQSRTLLFSLRDSQRYSSQVRFIYYLKASDSGGRAAVLPIFVTKVNSSSKTPSIKITFEFTVASFQMSEVFVNQSIFMSDVISQLYSLSSGISIITNQYSAQYGPIPSRKMTWQPELYQDCSSLQVLKKTKEVLQPNSVLLKQFNLAFMPQFNLKRIYYSSSCEGLGTAPSSSGDTLEFNVTMCSPFVYKLPAETFVDSTDGNISSLSIKLLGKDNRELPLSSWILLNSASLQLYAIYQSSMMLSTISSHQSFQSFQFNLEATNSRGLKSYKNVKINVLNYPYTSDCYTTISVQRIFGPSEMTTLDVLYRLVTAISQYYNDATVKLKVFKFIQQSNLSYQLTFSNCSFAFNTMKRAREGLDESYRTAISSIFLRMVQGNGSVQIDFKNSLYSSGFKLQNATVSYSCIDAPPFPKVPELIRSSFFTLAFNDVLPYDIFVDVRDGLSLKLSLHYVNGTEVSPDEWLQINPMTRTIFGSITMMQSFVTTYRYLLIATDSSYRTAKISYVVRIANSPPKAEVMFYVGFNSTFTKFSKTAYVLRNFTLKIAKFMGNSNDGKNIVIQRYQSFSSISWIYSQLNCNSSSVTAMIANLQKTAFKPVPSEKFKAALGPEFTVTNIIADATKCLHSRTVEIIVNDQINLNSSVCGYVQYRIPDKIFRSSIGETTKDLLLNLQSTTGNSISSSSVVQFFQDSQYLRIVAVFSRISQYLTYRLHAKSPRSTSGSAFTDVRLNFPDYQKVKAIEYKLCTLTVNLTTRYNPSVSESEMIQMFMNGLGNYLGTFNHQIQIISYTRYWIFPVKLTIKFSRCEWFSMIQSPIIPSSYFTQLDAMTAKLFDAGDASTNIAKKEFIDSLKPDFNIESIELNNATCKQHLNRPPSGKIPDLKMAPRCGEFQYQLPADLFSDEDGNIRSLRTHLFQNDGTELPNESWIVYNNITQTILGLPTDEAISKQPIKGYWYRLVATDKQGLSSYISIRIKIDGAPHILSSGMVLKLSYKSAIERKFKTDLMLAFTRKLSSYRLLNDPRYKFHIKSAIASASTITLSLLNCNPCSPEAMIKYNEISRKPIDLQNHMSPEFPVSYSVEASGNCSPLSDNYNIITTGSAQNITFCKRTRLDFLMLNTATELPPDTKIIIRQRDMSMFPQDSWFWFNESSSILDAFPNERIWKREKESDTPYLWSTSRISTNIRLGSFIGSSLRIVGTPPSSGLSYTITFKSTFSSNQVDAYYISLMFDAVALYFGREDIQHVSFTRQAGNVLTWNFFVCGLPSNCSDPNVMSLNNKIYSQSEILRSEFKAVFPNEVNIDSMTNNCSNSPPMILKPNLNLTVPICGLYQYQIPRDFAVDREDGDARNLTFSLRMPSGNFLPRDSWVQLNETSHEIYAFPLEKVSKNPRASGWEFLLIARDSGGAQTQTPLRIFVEQDQSTFYSFNFTFQTVNQPEKATYLDVQVQFLSKISNFFFDSSLSQYRVLAFEKIRTPGLNSEEFNIKFGNCSVKKYVCKLDDGKLTFVQERIMSSSMDANSIFSRFIGNHFRILQVQNDSHYSIDKAPVVLSSFNTIKLTMCDKFVKEIPKLLFYDAEAVDSGKLTKTLIFGNTSSVPSDYWMQIVNEHIYAVPYGDIKRGAYKFRLVATDMCGQSASTPVNVVLEDEARTAGVEVDMVVTSHYSEEKLNAFYVSQIQEKIKTGMGGLIDRVRVTYFEKKDDTIKIKWLNCSGSCKRNSNALQKQRIYQSKIFRDAFLPHLTVANLTSIDLPDCLKDLAPIHNSMIRVSVCQKLNFTLPANRFFNSTSRKFNLQLLNESKYPVGEQEWLQYNKEKQSIYGYPRNLDQSSRKRRYTYFLLATDLEGNNELLNLTVEIADNPNVTQKFTISGETEMSQEAPLVAQEITLIKKIGSFFGNYKISNMLYSRNGKSINFTWSFCNTNSEVCDCNQIRKNRERLRNVNEFKQYMQPEVNVKGNVDDTILAACEDEQTPRLVDAGNQSEVRILPGQYFSIEIRERKFYDYEDGYTRNLTLYLTDTSGLRFDRFWWFKIQDYKLCGLQTLYDSIQMTSRKAIYKTAAQDQCGNEAVEFYNVTVLQKMPKLSYRVTVYMNNSFGDNCTKINSFTQKISSYIIIPEIKIYVYNYTSYNGTYNTSVVTWGLTNITERNCTNGTMQELTDQFIFSNGSINDLFIKHMEPEYQVIFHSLFQPVGN